MTCSSFQDNVFPVSFAAFFRNFNGYSATEVVGGKRTIFQKLVGCAVAYHLSAVATCARANVKNIIGFEHHVFVVLYDQNGVSQISQFFQRINEANVVALMEANAWLVHNVQNTCKLRTDLRGQSDALCFAARKRF